MGLMMNNRRVAAELRDLFGSEPLKRMTLAEVAANLYERSVYTNRTAARNSAFDLMWDYEARGLVENSPGPRGGAGWKLSATGAALMEAQSSTPFFG